MNLFVKFVREYPAVQNTEKQLTASKCPSIEY
jgi:hypothetical protein